MLRCKLQPIVIAFTLLSSVATYSYAQETPVASAPAKSASVIPQAATSQDTAGQGQNSAMQLQATGTAAPTAPEEKTAETKEPAKNAWPFDGMRGTVDKQAAQRGFQIYSQVCSLCHSMDLVAYRDLSKLGFSEAEIKAVASQKQVSDMDDSGQTVQRKAAPFDHFVAPYANEKASRAANNGAYPPDLSLIIKAREDGPNYVYSLLTGFGTAPPHETPVAGKYYNPYFPGHWISMPPPLRDNAVSYQDGTTASVDRMTKDVVIFLQWAAEPEMEQRHEMGIKVLIFLFIMTALFYVAKKRVWKKAGK